MLTEKQEREADVVARYLAGKPASSGVAHDYWRAVDSLNAHLDEQQQKIWQRMISSSMLLRCMDAGLALTCPSSPLRRRIFIMLAILETEPAMADRFLPRDRSSLYIIAIGLRGVRAVFSAVAGVLLVKWWRLA